MAAGDFFVRFWGVRGSIPCTGQQYLEFGGNSPCVEVRCDNRVLVLDAGTGARGLGDALVREKINELDLLFTHCHYDHVCGLPFFAPLYCPGVAVRLWVGQLVDGMAPEAMVQGLMRQPYFPVGPDVFQAQIDYRSFRPGSRLDLGDGIVIVTANLNHPGGSIGYRIEYGGKSICYVTDTEHVPESPDRAVIDLIRNADIVIYDAAYTDEEFDGRQGYGHSTWQEGIRVCDRAGAAQYVIFHHCPTHDDAFLQLVEREAQAIRPNSVVAREGMVLRP